MKDKIVENVVDKFQLRSAVGIKKYNTTLEANNTDDFFNHLQEELMDATLYIEKLQSQVRLTDLQICKFAQLIAENPNVIILQELKKFKNNLKEND